MLATDEEYLTYLPYLFEISHTLMVKLYAKNRVLLQSIGANGESNQRPEINLAEYMP